MTCTSDKANCSSVLLTVYRFRELSIGSGKLYTGLGDRYIGKVNYASGKVKHEIMVYPVDTIRHGKLAVHVAIVKHDA